MLEQLFGSKTRVKLLKLFYNNPARSFYVREITRKIDEQINSVRRELANLIAVGLIRSKESNNRLYYNINKDSQFYNEFKKIFTNLGDIPTEEDAMAKRLRGVGKVEYAQLSGTFVQDANNKVDLFIVGDINRAKLATLVEELEKENHRDINYTVLTPEEFNYRKTLYDKFISEVLDSPKNVIIDEFAEKEKEKVV